MDNGTFGCSVPSRQSHADDGIMRFAMVSVVAVAVAKHSPKTEPLAVLCARFLKVYPSTVFTLSPNTWRCFHCCGLGSLEKGSKHGSQRRAARNRYSVMAVMTVMTIVRMFGSMCRVTFGSKCRAAFGKRWYMALRPLLRNRRLRST
jgi:hypothetical protein